MAVSARRLRPSCRRKGRYSTVHLLRTAHLPPCDSGFVSICGQALGCDIHNLGFAGSCYLENVMVDYIASLSNIDFCVAELGTNCWHSDYNTLTDEAFCKRTEYLIETFINAHPKSHLFLIDCLHLGDCYDDCRELIRRAVITKKHSRIHYICGRDLLIDSLSISADGVHPSAFGHRRIAQNLLEILCEKLEKVNTKTWLRYSSAGGCFGREP